MAGLATTWTRLEGWVLFIALHAYLLTSTYAMFYEFGCECQRFFLSPSPPPFLSSIHFPAPLPPHPPAPPGYVKPHTPYKRFHFTDGHLGIQLGALWTTGTDDFGLQPPNRQAHVWAVLLWVGLGLVRLECVTAWQITRWRSFRTKIRLLGGKTAMQSDPYSIVVGSWRPQRIRDNTGRPRFCKLHDACFDSGRPLADRDYHCSYIGRKCDKDGRVRGIHLPVYDHYCHWIGVVVYLDTIKPYLLTISFLFLDAMCVFSCSVALLIQFLWAPILAAMMVLSAILVVWLALYNMWKQIKYLAMHNITYPERTILSTKRYRHGWHPGAFWFRVQLDNEFLHARFVSSLSP